MPTKLSDVSLVCSDLQDTAHPRTNKSWWRRAVSQIPWVLPAADSELSP